MDVKLADALGVVWNDAVNVTSIQASAAGNTAVQAPSSGRAIRLFYLVVNADGANSGDVTAALRFGAAGVLLYPISLKPGSIFARNIGAGRRYIQGVVGESLFINLSDAQTVNVTIEWEEVEV